MKRALILLLILFFVGPLALDAAADWDPGDGHKMHFPQLPNPDGWDVDITRRFVADDWKCSASGPVSDIHFWYSWQGGVVGNVQAVQVRIWDDDRTGPYSKPGNLLWDRILGTPAFTTRLYGTGDQGWYTPPSGGSGEIINLNDHDDFYQLNIHTIQDPFIQQFDEIYWLELHLIPADGFGFAGWKTSLDHFEDDAVWEDQQEHFELFDPIAQPPVSLDMAFVITPEPGSLMLLAGGLSVIFLGRRHTEI